MQNMEYVLLKLGTTTDYFSDIYYLCFPTYTHRLIESTTTHKNNETNDKFYHKVAFLMYTEMVNFTLKS